MDQEKIKHPPKIKGPIPTAENGNILTLYWPGPIQKDHIGGYKLKNNKGFISVEENYQDTDGTGRYTKFSHTYRYTTQEYEYLVNHLADKDCKMPVMLYNFRFDKDPHHENEGLLNHLQVLHNHPRFPTEEQNLLSFLKIIDKTCFKDRQTTYNTPFYSNRMK
jgi:hypothetical protein